MLGLLATLLAAAPAEPPCPYTPAYRRVRAALAKAQPAAALAILYRYRASPENNTPFLCEASAVQDEISKRETKMVRLVSGARAMRPGAVYHCDKYDPKMILCNGPFSDDTAHPHTMGAHMEPEGLGVDGRIESDLPGARLVGVYRQTIERMFDDTKPAIRLGTGARVKLKRGDSAVLMAIFTAPKGQGYRKFVWYL